ncbi:unnamed protein product [Adineta steineri]|uniref:Uncharacterized protein n=1 Tax=Adineta steineri TaxID=433720 RepID=A0A815BLN1_9BILA|nr:unnamed protein product [Adineta steineri]
MALSSSLINSLYLFYLVQTLRSKTLLDINCRAIYYLQASCVVVLAYTVAAMHANFILSLFPPSTSTKHTCLQSCGLSLRRFFRRFCFCLVLCIWSLSFTSTIPLLYTIDSNEKSPKPVYCPGTTQISYLEEWFNRNRFTQTVVFYLIPLLISSFLTMIAMLKILYDSFQYLYIRIRMSRCSPCRKNFSPYQQQQQQSIPQSMSFLQALGLAGNNNNTRNDGNLPSTIEQSMNEITPMSPLNLPVQSCGRWLSSTFLRLLLILSCCLLACIYPIAMRFYLIYFSVLVPLVFAVLNYSLGQLATTQEQEQQQPLTMENHHTTLTNSAGRSSTATYSSLNITTSKSPQIATPPIIHEQDNISHEQFELQSSLMINLFNEPDETLITPSSSSPPSTTPSTRLQQPSIKRNKRKYFSNQLYENTRSLFTKSNN